MASYAESKEELLKRLRKIEGQVKGIQRMIEEDKYCVDILIQIAAVRAAINKVGTIIFEHHTRGCLKSAIQNNNLDEMIEELINVLIKFTK
ncbi:metal-sensitive transcriptional regulator [Calderihabitans maritimus]|uniref:Copper-sensing transcriptional repressor CsoR n=1 Tax=Calderihabitans maritimus TaxID=1246530 RepID=A0A1Z5HTN3_9FIRM|nr:metal-sensitive transcriptional regulator [Calderihabitans maritimus]GAW92691.1 hypothetical protein Desor_0964 [Calderihabitans maritimus]